MVFLAIGAVSAADSINVMDTEDSNFMQDNAYSLSADNKLEISSEDSISETNIVNSHDDNLGNYPTDEALNSLIVNNNQLPMMQLFREMILQVLLVQVLIVPLLAFQIVVM